MFEKQKLKKELKKSKERIEEIEKRRTRSQAALVEAILRHTEPDDRDVDFFNQFTEQIELERSHMHEIQKKLDELG